MAAFLNQQLTDAGWDALSAAAGGGRLTFYKMQAGSGAIVNDAAIPPMTQLVAPVTDIGITKYEIDGKGQITLYGNIASVNLPAGFTFTELGVFAAIEQPVAGLGGSPMPPSIVTTPPTTVTPDIPDPSAGTPVMYSYCNSYELSDYIPGSGETTDVVNTIQVTVRIDKAVTPVVNITAGQQLSITNIGPPEVGAGPWSYTQANVAYLKRLVQGPGILLLEDADTITVEQKQLTADLDLYVANGNPDISPNFSTLQNAIDYLGQFLIPTTIKARINMSGQTFNTAQRIILNHPNAQNITIQGPQNPALTGTSITSITGSAYNWSVTFGGFTDTSSVAVGNYAIVDRINATAANNEGLVTGFFLVTAVTAATITVKVPYSKASLPVSGVNSVRLTAISALIVTTVKNVGGFYASVYGISLFQYVGFVAGVIPDASLQAFACSGAASLKYVGAYGYIATNPTTPVNCIGIAAFAGVNCTSCACTYNGIGYTGGIAFMDGNISSHNQSRNFWMDGASNSGFYEGTSRGSASGEINLLVTGGNNFGMGYNPKGQTVLKLQQSGSHGIEVYSRSSAWSNNYMPYANIDIRGTPAGYYDLCVLSMGLAIISYIITGPKLFNIPVGQLSNDGSLIQ
jgi:hypothetical protein